MELAATNAIANRFPDAAHSAAKETSDDKPLKDASKHVIDAVKAESTKPNISSVNAAITDGNFSTEHKVPDPVQRCLLPSAETTHEPQFPLPPGEKLADTVPSCRSLPDCPYFYVNESLSLEQR